MIWELLATIFAGLGAAGLVMAFRAVFKKLPKWLIPAGAGLGMLFFQVYNEYSWYPHTKSQLPTGTVVIIAVEKKTILQTVGANLPADHPIYRAGSKQRTNSITKPAMAAGSTVFFPTAHERAPFASHC